MAFLPRVRQLFRLDAKPASPEDDVTLELEAHVAMKTEALIAAGMLPGEARREAERQFGPPDSVAEECRALARGEESSRQRRERFGTMAQDIRYGVRTVTRAPGFFLLAVLTLGLSIGAVTAIYSIVDGVILQPLPYPNNARLVRLWEQNTRTGCPFCQLSVADFRDYSAQNHSFEGLAGLRFRTYTLTGLGDPQQLAGAEVTAAFFDLLGVRAAAGRTFQRGEDLPGAAAIAVMSDGLWKRRFGGEASAIGRTVQINGAPVTIIGVLPRGFVSPIGGDADLYRAGNYDAIAQDPARARRMHFFGAIGTLRPGASFEEGQADLLEIGRRLERDHPADNLGHLPRIMALQAAGVRDVRGMLYVLLAAVGFLLVIAGANLASMLLTRGLAREREFAVRTALGAGRGRLVRQLVTEQLFLAGTGATLGILLGQAGLRAGLRLASGALPRVEQVGLNWRVVLLAVAATVLTSTIAALYPALAAARNDAQQVLRRESGRSTGGRRQGRARAGLVATQVALAIILLTGCTQAVRAFVSLLRADLGFTTEGVWGFVIQLPSARYTTPASMALFEAGLVERLHGLPGVVSAAAAYTVPMANSSTNGFRVVGQPAPQGPEAEVGYNAVSGDYFKTLGIPLLAGRVMDSRDNSDRPAVVVINQSAARRFWPGGNPIGARIVSGPDTTSPPAEVIGVVGDIRRESAAVAPVPEAYYALSQDVTSGPYFAVRLSGDTTSFYRSVREQVAALDPMLPVFGVSSLDAVVGLQLTRPRLAAVLLGLFAGLALVLAAIGIYGVVAVAVLQRKREIGVRLALGARRTEIVGLVVRQGFTPVLVGMAAGSAGALALSGVARRVFSATLDPLPLLLTAALFGLVALAACWTPAYRAARLDPARVLRED